MDSIPKEIILVEDPETHQLYEADPDDPFDV